MQIRKYPASCGTLPHTREPSLEQVMCQEPLRKSRAEKGMGVPVQQGAMAFSSGLSWARCQQHRSPLANTLGRAQSCISSSAAPQLRPGGYGTEGMRHGHPSRNPSFTWSHAGLKSLAKISPALQQAANR